MRCVGTHTEKIHRLSPLGEVYCHSKHCYFSGRARAGSAATNPNNHAWSSQPCLFIKTQEQPQLDLHLQVFSTWAFSSATHCLKQSRCLHPGMLESAARFSARGFVRGQRAFMCKNSLADFLPFLPFCTIPTWPKVTFLHRNSILGAFEKSPHIHSRPVQPFPTERGRAFLHHVFLKNNPLRVP